MAAVKAKKPTTSKLKAGKKKSVNKWLILGGVAAVAIIGAVVVRFSSAATWKLRAYNEVNWTVTTRKFEHGVSYRIAEYEKVRGCVKAYSTDRTKNAVIRLAIGNNWNTREAVVSPKGGKYCVEFQNQAGAGSFTVVAPSVTKVSGPNVWVVATSVESLW